MGLQDWGKQARQGRTEVLVRGEMCVVRSAPWSPRFSQPEEAPETCPSSCSFRGRLRVYLPVGERLQGEEGP